MPEIHVTRLLQNPLGHVAPAGEPGDIVRITDGRRTIYLDPDTFATLTDDRLRELLVKTPPRRRR